MIRFHVPAVPVAMPRPRAMILNGHVHVHNPTHRKAVDGRRVSNGVAEFKASVRQAFEQAAAGRPPLDGPVSMRVVFVLPRPKSLIWKSKAMPRMHHVSKPDSDNLWKAVKDALKGLAWRDDSQVCDANVVKVTAAGHEQPGVDIEIAAIAAGEGVS